ncbi:MAG: hypothetical protein CL908_10035 [Deltaproteobacteria bacterium]|jgi:AcrR family transcriptional regulator|nr:hypothetical protein [Deltaproteobacteria bacterium]
MSSFQPGLRAEKRRRTHSEILANAISLFRERGLRGARMSDIARASAVSPATLFNYFPTKSALAEAWVRGEVDLALTTMASELGERSLRSALRGVCRQLAESGLDERQLRLEAWREVGRAALPPDDSDGLVQALKREQERERVRADLPAWVLREMLREALEGGLIDGLRTDEAGDGSAGEVVRRLRVRVDLVLDGARKRNERVAAPAASPRADPSNPSRRG